MNNINQPNLTCVFGLGKTGLAAVRYLERIKQPYVIIDTRQNPPGLSELEKLEYCVDHYFGDVPENIWTDLIKDCEQIILSPGVDPKISIIQQAIGLNIQVVSDIEIFVQNTKGKTIAITGSNGKSTVTDLTHKLLIAAGKNAKIGGNFGIPVLDFLPNDNADYYVLELSSFQLDITQSLNADVATVLNITEDHMDRYESFEDYQKSKLSIYNKAKNCLVNADDPLIKTSNLNQLKQFSVKRNADYCLVEKDQATQLTVNGKTVLSTNELGIKGKHNWSNALASLGLLNALEIAIDKPVLEALKSYHGLSHRFETVAENKAAIWINDSKATNVGATISAIESIDKNQFEPIVLIAGGESKGADLSPLKPSLESSVDLMVTLGKDASKLAELIDKAKVKLASSMEQAVSFSYEYLKSFNAKQTNAKKGLVLLSPACASLDKYKNFEVRGKHFTDCVEALL